VSLPDFVSEPIEPAAGSFDAAAMSRGEPGVPNRFTWRGREFVVDHVIRAWKSSTRDRGELYLRRHWYEIQMTSGERITLYCERQTKNRKKPKQRWWMYGFVEAEARMPKSEIRIKSE
jgi:hypothetical protein